MIWTGSYHGQTMGAALAVEHGQATSHKKEQIAVSIAGRKLPALRQAKALQLRLIRGARRALWLNK